MGTIIRNIFLFILCTLVFYVGISAIMTNISIGSKPVTYYTANYQVVRGANTFRRWEEFDRSSQYDIIFLGTSRCNQVYDPAYFESRGYKTFNFGGSHQPIENTFAFFDNYIHSENTKCVVLDLSDLAFFEITDPLPSDFDIIMNSPDISAARDILLRDRDVRIANIFLARIFYPDRLISHATGKTYRQKGFLCYTDTMSEKFCEEMKAGLHKVQVPVVWSDERFTKLESLIRLCAERNIKLIPVIGPTNSLYTGEIMAESVARYKQVFSKYNVPVYDLHEIPGIESCVHFYDELHMNEAGVNIYSPYVMEHIGAVLPPPSL